MYFYYWLGGGNKLVEFKETNLFPPGKLFENIINKFNNLTYYEQHTNF